MSSPDRNQNPHGGLQKHCNRAGEFLGRFNPIFCDRSAKLGYTSLRRNEQFEKLSDAPKYRDTTLRRRGLIYTDGILIARVKCLRDQP